MASDRTEPWKAWELSALAGACFLLGLLLPVLWHGDWERLLSAEAWRPFASPELVPGAGRLFLEHLLEILLNNLGIAFLASWALPLLAGRLRPWARNLPGLYVAAVSFTAGVVATPARMMGGGWFLLNTLPFAFLEVGGYVAAGLAGLEKVWRGRANPRLIALSLLLILAGGTLEAATIVLLYEPAIGGRR